MHCIDQHVIKQIYIEVDKATKNLYSDEQLEQIIANLVESRVNRHIIDRSHQMLNDIIDSVIDAELTKVIEEEAIAKQVRHISIKFLRSEAFRERMQIFIEHCDIHGLSDALTLKELKEYFADECF
jgi:hypothetical protein